MNEQEESAAPEKLYIVELNEETYIDLMRLVLKHPDEITLLTRTCVAYAKPVTK